jgi:hypothetical protein
VFVLFKFQPYPPDEKILALHEDLKKAESSMLVQIRTEKTGLADFLHRIKVPGWETGQCECGAGLETARHVIRWCTLETDRRAQLLSGGRLDYRRLTREDQTGRVARWLIRSGRLPQFSLANVLLYG